MMKKLVTLTLLVVSSVFVLSGCDNQPNTPKVDKSKVQVNENLTSQQLEAKIGWKYCEEYN
jgi:uncharacterized lipoprotein NlpE involved in copper resistance